MTTPDRLDAYCALLAQPDPPDLEPRAHVLTVEGWPGRFRRYRGLPLVYVAQRQIQRENEGMR